MLFDNSLNTVFSTKTTTNTSDGEDPYIRVLLPGTAYADLDMQLVYSTSGNATDTWAPTSYVIETSPNGTSDWTEVQRVTEKLPITSSTTYTSEWFKFVVGQQYVRVKVNSSRHNVDDAEPQLVEGHPFFNLSEFSINYMLAQFVPDTVNYPKATEKVMHDAWIATLDAERVMLNQHTRDDIQQAYDELVPYYEGLLQLIGKNTMQISNACVRCVDDSDNSTVVFDCRSRIENIARSPIGYKIDLSLQGLPDGYPVRLAEISFTNLETQETYTPKGNPSPADHGFFTVNYPQDMPLGHYMINITLPETSEYDAYTGYMPEILLDVYMKSDERLNILTHNGLRSLDVNHLGTYLTAERDRFVYRLPIEPADDVIVFHKVTTAADGANKAHVRKSNSSRIPEGYEVYDHAAGVSIPRTNPAGTMSFIIEKAGVPTPATEISYSGLPQYDLESGIYLVGSFCDYLVNEKAIFLGPLPSEDQLIYKGYYRPEVQPESDVVLGFAQYTLTDNYTKFYGPREYGSDFLSASNDVVVENGNWKGYFGYNNSHWIFSPSAFDSSEGLEFTINFINNAVAFGQNSTVMTGIDEINALDNEAEYYTLSGLRVKNPAPGIYICLKDGQRTKVLLK